MIHVPTTIAAGAPWSETPIIVGGTNEPDRWTATKSTASGVVVHEVGLHNAGIVRGQKARGAFPCTVTIEPPTGWTMVYDCYRALPSVWYPMHESIRRVAMYPSNRPDLAAEAQREAKMPYFTTRWRRGRAAYGPCNLPLPNLTATQAAQEASKIAGWLARYQQILSVPGAIGQVEDSQEGIFVPRDGWTPDGITNRGAEGGSNVFFYYGWENAPLSPAYHWIKACCGHERWWHAYDRNTGAIVTAEFYGDPGPMYQQGTGDPNNGWLPEFIGVAQHPDPLLMPYDAGHSVRGWSDLIPLSEMTDSPAVKRMLRSVAAQMRLQLSDIGPHVTNPNYVPPSLRHNLAVVAAAPHTGFMGMDTGRQFGWTAYLIAQSVKRAGATENVNWCRMYAEFSETGSMPNGILSRCWRQPNPNDVWYDPTYDLAHAFEVPIEKHGAIGCGIQGNRPIANPLRWADALYIEAPMLPYYGNHGPPQYAWVANRGGAPRPTIDGGKGNTGDSTHSHAGCALAAKMDPANRQKWIQAALFIEAITDMRKDAGIVAQMQISP